MHKASTFCTRWRCGKVNNGGGGKVNNGGGGKVNNGGGGKVNNGGGGKVNNGGGGKVNVIIECAMFVVQSLSVR